MLPSKDTAKGYMDAYFEHGNATCRFLVPEETYQKLDQLYTQTDQGAQSQIDMTIALLVIGTGYGAVPASSFCLGTADHVQVRLDRFLEK